MPLSSSTRRRVPQLLSRVFYIAAFLVILREVFRGTHWVRAAVDLFSSLVFPVDTGGFGLAVYCGIVGAALMRRKRVAWWMATVWLGIWWLAEVVAWVAILTSLWQGGPLDRGLNGELLEYGFGVVTTTLLLWLLVTNRREFTARLTPGSLRAAALTALAGIVASLGAGYLLGMVAGRTGRPRSRLISIVQHVVYGQNASMPKMVPGWVQSVVGLLIGLSLLAGLLVLMRSQRSQATSTLGDELELRRLLAQNPEDSLGYFATRRDKQVVFAGNGQSAITYRVQFGVCLASGDPIGRREQWDGAVSAYVGLCHTYGWTPGVVGASEAGAGAYERGGLRVIRVGDEAILNPQSFTLEARELKAVRGTVTRLKNLGYTVRVRRHDEIASEELDHLIALSEQWRDGDDRGFSMALNRLGDPLDGACVMVQAIFPPGSHQPEQTAGLLSFVPWGADGLSLDVMRRNPEADNGITEFMVAGLMGIGRERGWQRVSLNFAVFRSAFEEGERIGATALDRAKRRVLMIFSRWFQIEQLYRSNVKYAPAWQPRFLAYEDAADIGQVGAAMGLAEGFLDLPGWGNPMPAIEQPLTRADDPVIMDFLARPVLELPTARVPEQMRGRLDKRAALLAEGQQPYPVTTGVDAQCADVVGRPGERITIGGRIVGVSDHGGVCFVRLQDFSGATQALLEASRMGRDELRRFDDVTNLGDQVAFGGVCGASKTGTPSLLVDEWRLTSKCLRPLPDKYKGISNPEALVRQRYLDMIVNPVSRDRLAVRSRAFQAVRQTFLDEGYLEVETPILQTIHGGANARPFRTHINAYDLDLYLRIAPELYLKRLMVGGCDRVFEIGRNFRNEGADATHNPEFSVVEAYQAHADYRSMRRLTETMVRRAAVEATGSSIVRGTGADGAVHEVDLAEPWRWISVHDAISEGLGEQVTPDTSRQELARHASRLGLDVVPSDARSDVLESLYEELCEKPTVAPTFFCDFPADLSPLTRPHREDDRLAERWDLVVFGSELGTAYSELVDPVIQRQRLTEQSLRAANGDPEAMEIDEDFLAALEYGMPPTGGLGIGLDRLVMLLTGASIRETIAFPLVRPRR
ncbi:MAG: bifunctional lysylphosphatidylglycerol synthetase/lysine--tRNA ligase LysX [Luteococcus sp.]|uniref:bifunctional lysylphosphatidylglycerol synthetase/lysine--tRNA ligase LysX n=1 Tax=Luteococcus sp. TaxID=1969402 RepID=UPI0026487FF4|nr:bifunctional lysylphosphatidylglycerol synthetase/lysine--tRNA ligase LysX [Luteococcus sp.]MDN5562827.1 bifunctional lysylphosphatidylglycerol synthetase/lysine--tRNA ligase LysX [Luteococcus sp.]